MPPRCGHNPPLLPPAGESCAPHYCCLCHLYATDESYRLYWDSKPYRLSNEIPAATLPCPDCPGKVAKKLTPERTAAWCADFLCRPFNGRLPDGWETWENVAEGFRILFTQAAASIPKPPAFTEARGVVICGGGWRFYPSVYVTVRALRHTGCTWPIQVWFFGDSREYDTRMSEALEAYDPIEWVNANAVWRERPGMAIRQPNLDNGWALKPFAAAYAPFREVVSLDADSYPVRNLDEFMGHENYWRHGLCFWPDGAGGFKTLPPETWRRFGLEPNNAPSLESGQFVIDKARHWEPLWLTCWLNAHHEYVYRHLYGDKDTFNMAWAKLGRSLRTVGKPAHWSLHSFLQRGFDGQPLFVHRIHDKFKLGGPVDGKEPTRFYMSGQRNKAGNVRNDALPLEAECFAWLEECDRFIRPEAYRDALAGAG